MNHSRTCCHSKERTKGKESIIKVAAIQTEPYFGEKEKNIQRQLQLIEKAGNEGVLLLTLPELASTEYVFNTRGYLPLSTQDANRRTTSQWSMPLGSMGCSKCSTFGARFSWEKYILG